MDRPLYLMIDCTDSFTHNLSALFEISGADVMIVNENDVFSDMVEKINPSAVIISPGPGSPDPGRGSWKIVAECRGKIPVFGVCLGHQTIAAVMGCEIVRCGKPMHGKIVGLIHSGKGLFSGIPPGISVVRYNSLCVNPSSVPENVSVDAVDDIQTVMAISMESEMMYGVQFHPESFMSGYGKEIVENFMNAAERK
jgi:anthranilate synthase/aminodeoxychorismate synthase-like glutamine amidotransferase